MVTWQCALFVLGYMCSAQSFPTALLYLIYDFQLPGCVHCLCLVVHCLELEPILKASYGHSAPLLTPRIIWWYASCVLDYGAGALLTMNCPLQSSWSHVTVCFVRACLVVLCFHVHIWLSHLRCHSLVTWSFTQKHLRVSPVTIPGHVIVLVVGCS